MTEETEITAFLDGTVIKAADSGWNLGLGKYVVIDHGSGISTVYASLGSVDVSEGQEVSAGDTIARAGMTGRSTGIHLHFEIRENGRAEQADELLWESEALLGWSAETAVLSLR